MSRQPSPVDIPKTIRYLSSSLTSTLQIEVVSPFLISLAQRNVRVDGVGLQYSIVLARMAEQEFAVGSTVFRKSEQTEHFEAASLLPKRTTKMSEVIALDMVRSIVANGLEPGDTLPSEAEMLAKYRVARSTLREAMRLLEVQGLITIRPGPGSGVAVGQVHPGNLGRTLTLYLHLRGSTYDELLSAWTATEPLMARLAAENPDREAVTAAFSPYLDHHADEPCSIQVGTGFHELICKFANNSVLELVARAIGAIIRELVLSSVKNRDRLEPRTIHDHRAIAGAIIRGDGFYASELMALHLRHVAEDFKAYWPRSVGDRVEWS